MFRFHLAQGLVVNIAMLNICNKSCTVFKFDYDMCLIGLLDRVRFASMVWLHIVQESPGGFVGNRSACVGRIGFHLEIRHHSHRVSQCSDSETYEILGLHPLLVHPGCLCRLPPYEATSHGEAFQTSATSKGPAARCQWSLSESEGQDPKDREVQRSRNWRWWSPACCYAGCFVGHQACIQAGLLRSLEGCKPGSPGLETERPSCCTGARASGPCTNHRAQEWVSQDCTLQEEATAGGRLGL